jgi:hypothetical protein
MPFSALFQGTVVWHWKVLMMVCSKCLNLLKDLVDQVQRCYTCGDHEGIIHGVVVLLEELQDTEDTAVQTTQADTQKCVRKQNSCCTDAGRRGGMSPRRHEARSINQCCLHQTITARGL